MSRSNNEEQLQNPSKRWFEWSSKNKTVIYYDKVKKERVQVELPFTFLLLEELTKVTGYNKALDKPYYSNEVKNQNAEKLNVKCEKSTVEIGLWPDIGDAVKAKGGKFAKSLYIAYKDDNGSFEIGNITIDGAALGGGDFKNGKEKIHLDGWFEFSKKSRKDLYDKAIKMNLEPRVCQNGSTEFSIPTYALAEVSEETNEIAKALDADLQNYLKVYFAKSNTKQEEEPAAPATSAAEPNKLAATEAAYGSPRSREEFTAPNNDFTAGFGASSDEENDSLPF